MNSLMLNTIEKSFNSPITKQAVKKALPSLSIAANRLYRTDISKNRIPPKMIPPDERPIEKNAKIHEIYAKKKTDYPTIISEIKNLKQKKGDLPYVAIAQGAESPEAFLEELDKHQKMVKLYQMLPQKLHPSYNTQDFRTTFATKLTRDKTFIPMHFKDVPNYLQKNANIVVTQLSPMDENGYFTAGTGATYAMPITNKDKIVIGEINKQMPQTFGTKIHVSDLDYLVETDRKLYELPEPKIGPVEQKIGENVSKFIKNGDTLQVGIGAIPNAVLNCLENHKNIKIHSEMISDGVANLYEKGVIEPNIVTGFALGSKKLYDIMNNNPDFRVYNIDYTNNQNVVSQIDNLISINSVLAMDLLGESAADRFPPKGQISGIGGHFDFGYNASASILAFPSTTIGKDGKLKSKIVLFLPEGASTTMSRNDVDMVCTEYGLVKLKGYSVEERVNKLISIAHPKFRDALSKKAKESGLI